ncbi:MAG TPA: AraC family transcriptional regulator [Verrucomicrobiales bacterium]|nr:AraC family transcriptional regulator [Verrucomicrobiales bacterium]
MNANETLVDTLAKSPLYREFEAAYTEATGLPVTLRPLETWQLPLHGKKRENGFCGLMAEKSRTCAACLQMQEKLCQAAVEQPHTLTCNYGLCETAVPVRLGTECIGYLQTGQVMRQKPTRAQFEKVAREFQEMGHDIPQDRLEELYFATPIVTSKKLESATQLLRIFAEHLAIKSNQIAVQTQNTEPPVITRARKYIQEHQDEDLSLGQVARAVNTSTFYFCKLFKRATGLHFTEYVSRSRIEKAKNLLLNPNLRISEIAFAVGFQSLTHFNRVFKKVLGESPTQYRRRLPR